MAEYESVFVPRGRIVGAQTLILPDPAEGASIVDAADRSVQERMVPTHYSLAATRSEPTPFRTDGTLPAWPLSGMWGTGGSLPKTAPVSWEARTYNPGPCVWPLLAACGLGKTHDLDLRASSRIGCNWDGLASCLFRLTTPYTRDNGGIGKGLGKLPHMWLCKIGPRGAASSAMPETGIRVLCTVLCILCALSARLGATPQRKAFALFFRGGGRRNAYHRAVT